MAHIHAVRYPLNRWREFSELRPIEAVIRHGNGDPVWSLFDAETDRLVGYMRTEADAVWLQRASRFVPMAIEAIEQVLIQRDVVAQALFELDPLTALAIRNFAGMPKVTHTDWISTLADEVEDALHLGNLE